MTDGMFSRLSWQAVRIILLRTLYTVITQSLNMAQCEDNLRGATCQWLGCCVRTSRLWKQAVVFMLCCVQESDSGTNVCLNNGCFSPKFRNIQDWYFTLRIMLCESCFTNRAVDDEKRGCRL